MDNIPGLKTNSFIWGQATGCVYRFQKYAEFSSENDDALKTKQILLNSYTGNPDTMLEDLKKVGYQSGFLGKSSITFNQWATMIDSIAQNEYETGTSWLQALGCLKLFHDYKIYD